MPDQVVFYDLPSLHKGDGSQACFSWNSWKTRSILNYKKIPYQVEFVEYPDFEPRLKALGVVPQGDDAFAAYTSPTIQLPDGTFVAESNNCAETLESLYPEPTLHLDAGLHRNIMAKVDQAMSHMGALAMIIFVRRCLTERSAEWFLADREKRFGIDLENLAKLKGEEMFTAAEVPGGAFEQLRDEIHKHKRDDGPYVLGSQISYGDLVIVSLFESVQRVDQALYERFMGFDPSFKHLHEACKLWFERDD